MIQMKHVLCVTASDGHWVAVLLQCVHIQIMRKPEDKTCLMDIF